MNKAGHIIGSTTDEKTSFRQLIIKDVGTNQGTYYLLESFGEASLPPVDTRTIVIDSANKDVSYCLGALNKLDFSDLEHGDKILFSTNKKGTEIMSQITMRNTGNVEILAKGDITINVDGNANIVATQFNVNNGNLTVD